MEEIFENTKKFFTSNRYSVLAIIGLIIMIGAIFNCKWVSMSNSKFVGTRAFIKNAFGEKTERNFERLVFFLLGLLLVALSAWGISLN